MNHLIKYNSNHKTVFQNAFFMIGNQSNSLFNKWRVVRKKSRSCTSPIKKLLELKIKVLGQKMLNKGYQIW